MRLITGELALSLHGKIDKSGHQNIERKDQKNPDFIFHIPGHFDSNSVIVEVKVGFTKDGVKKDLETLNIYIEKYNYKYGVFIICDVKKETLLNKIKQMDLSSLQNKSKIYLLIKKSEDTDLETFKLDEFLRS